MADISIAHFGTTLIESAPPEGADQATIPMTGDLERTDQFLSILGAEIYIRNMYPGIGRQFIYRRGEFSDPDYFEKDTFTSYVAEPIPDAGKPRASEAIFRVPHADAQRVANELIDADLIVPRSSLDEFLKAGKDGRLLFSGPDGQQYELTSSAPNRSENHRVYIWTHHADLDDHIAAYEAHFGLKLSGTEDFFGRGTSHLLVRDDPGMTVALITAAEGDVAPKHSFDIFKDAGYSHFRLGAPDKQAALAVSEEAFPDGGGQVSFVHFKDSYLELVQVGEELATG